MKSSNRTELLKRILKGSPRFSVREFSDYPMCDECECISDYWIDWNEDFQICVKCFLDIVIEDSLSQPSQDQTGRDNRTYLRREIAGNSVTDGVPPSELSVYLPETRVTDVKHAPGNGLDKHTYELVATWISNGMKERSEHAFTVGLARDVAFLVQLSHSQTFNQEERLGKQTPDEDGNTYTPTAVSAATESVALCSAIYEDNDMIANCELSEGHKGKHRVNGTYGFHWGDPLYPHNFDDCSKLGSDCKGCGCVCHKNTQCDSALSVAPETACSDCDTSCVSTAIFGAGDECGCSCHKKEEGR